MASFTQDQLEFFGNHLFLPPKLPQESDQDTILDDALLRLVTETLPGFAACLPVRQQQTVQDVFVAINQLAATRDANGAVDEEMFLKALGQLNIANTGK